MEYMSIQEILDSLDNGTDYASVRGELANRIGSLARFAANETARADRYKEENDLIRNALRNLKEDLKL